MHIYQGQRRPEKEIPKLKLHLRNTKSKPQGCVVCRRLGVFKYTKVRRKEHGRYHGVLSLGQLTLIETQGEAPSQKSLQESLERQRDQSQNWQSPLKRYSSLEKKIGSIERQKLRHVHYTQTRC